LHIRTASADLVRLPPVPQESYSHETTTAATPSEVWSALDRPSTWEGIPGVDRVLDPVVDDQGKLRGFRFESVVAGKRYTGRATPSVRTQGTAMGWAITTPELKGTVTVRVTTNDAMTRVAIDLEVESVGMLASVFFPAIAASIRNGYVETVERFVGSLA
jgi:carbon monoxide dehydrogenase subunit G